MVAKNTGTNSTVIRLLIVLSLLAIGKLHGQETIFPQLIYVQYLPPTVPLNNRRQTIIIAPDQNWQTKVIETERTQNPMQQAANIEQFTLLQSVSGSNILPEAVTDSITTKRRFSTQKPDKMSQPPTGKSFTRANTSDADGNTDRNDLDSETSHGRVISEENGRKPVLNLKQPSPVPETNEKSTISVKKNPVSNETPQDANKNPIVTVDERSFIDGDPCPTGYVRFNGKCVEKE